MLNFYENKGRKIFIAMLFAIIIGFSVGFILSKFIAFDEDMDRVDKIAQQAQKTIAKTQKEKTYNGQIEYVEGIAEKRNNRDAGWFQVEKSDIIKSGDQIRTLVDSRAIITFEDGSAVRLDENTNIIFNGRGQNILIDMDKGFVYNKVAKNDKREYSIKTGDYMVTALGTEFGVKNDGDDVDVMVVESEVSVVGANNGVVLDNVEEGNKATVKDNKVVKTKITQKDLGNEFIAWSAGKDILSDEIIVGEEASSTKITVDKEDVIKLSGEKSSSGVKLHWDTSGVNISHGFKVVKSKEINPVYPGSDYKYLSDSGVRDYKWKIDSGKKYHFRVCVYLGDGKCGTYSNDIYVDTPDGDYEDDKGDGGYANKVSLSANKDGVDVKLKWDISGGDAPKGFKVVKSKNKNPVYPGDDYKYLSDGDKHKYTWKDLKDNRIYYFRVCIYQGGKCGTYSNNVKISL